MSFDRYLDPTLHVTKTGSGERRWYCDKKGNIALVWNWKGIGKWKVLPDLDMPFRRAYKYTKEQFDSFEDACRVYDMLCATNGLTSIADA